MRGSPRAAQTTGAWGRGPPPSSPRADEGAGTGTNGDRSTGTRASSFFSTEHDGGEVTARSAAWSRGESASASASRGIDLSV